MTKNDENSGFKLSGMTLKVITVIMGLAAAYFLTIQSIKVELAHKADGKTVEIIDKKLTNIEVLLKEGVVSKEQFYRFSKDVEARLTRIEILLKDKTGDKIGKK